jgi:hypothetical protein
VAMAERYLKHYAAIGRPKVAARPAPARVSGRM